MRGPGTYGNEQMPVHILELLEIGARPLVRFLNRYVLIGPWFSRTRNWLMNRWLLHGSVFIRCDELWGEWVEFYVSTDNVEKGCSITCPVCGLEVLLFGVVN